MVPANLFRLIQFIANRVRQYSDVHSNTLSMSFYEKYAKADSRALIEMLENASDYVEACLNAVRDILSFRDLDPDELLKMAKEINLLKARETIERLDPINDELIMHKSHFLNDEEIHEIYTEALDQHMKNKEGFRFNVWLYALGGG